METQTLTILSFVGNFVLVLSILAVNWKRGASTGSKEVIEIREKQVQALRDEVKHLDTQRKEDKEKFHAEIKDLVSKIGELTGQLNARLEENKRLTDLVTNQSPEMKAFLQDCKAIFPTITQLVGLMQKIDSHLQK